MKKSVIITTFGVLALFAKAQTVQDKIGTAFQRFENDSQLKSAIASLYVIDAVTGEVIFDKNSRIGLAPASTQKIITSITSFALLGKDFRYKTYFFLEGSVLKIGGNGDPTFGSWRYPSTKDTSFFNSLFKSLPSNSLISEVVFHGTERRRSIPSGWIYEDIGNYYGASPGEFNWRENQYDLTFIPGNPGDPAPLDTLLLPVSKRGVIINNCKTGAPGGGDNAYVYFLPGQDKYVIEGTVPAGVKSFTISAADPEPAGTFVAGLQLFGKQRMITRKGLVPTVFLDRALAPGFRSKAQFVHSSPALDSIIYWFNKKSINLYGEALLKTIAFEQTGHRSTDSGILLVRKFWKEHGVDERELNMYDGSGLSPLNRISTHAQVDILKYAVQQPWYMAFYNSLPDYNGMHMKSGTISDVKGFCGYHQSNGRKYIFSFLVNNYSGRAGSLVNKMYKVLDELK